MAMNFHSAIMYRSVRNEMDIQVKSIITGNALAGNITIGQFGTFPIKATKQ